MKPYRMMTLTLLFCWATTVFSGEKESLPRLIDLGAHQCIPCKKMAPILDELTAEYSHAFTVVFIDVWKSENIHKAKEYGIKMIPTQIFLDAQGKEVWRHEGFIGKKEILDQWKKLGLKLNKIQDASTEEKTVLLP